MLITDEQTSITLNPGDWTADGVFRDWCETVTVDTPHITVVADHEDLSSDTIAGFLITTSEVADAFDIPCVIVVAPALLDTVRALPLAQDFLTIQTNTG